MVLSTLVDEVDRKQEKGGIGSGTWEVFGDNFIYIH
jgi:hypothetical protein